MTKLQSKINKLSTILDDTNIDYVSSKFLEYILHESGIDLTTVTIPVKDETDDFIDIYIESNLGIQDIINGVGKPETVYLASEIRTLIQTKQVQDLLNVKSSPVVKTPKVNEVFTLSQKSITTLSNDTVDCLNHMFKGMILSFGLTIQLQNILPSFREYNNNEELRKKDLSKWLLKTGAFVKTPTGLYTYVNSIPLSQVEKLHPESPTVE